MGFLFTSESVNEGHPDKLADQISDGILDACLAQDPDSKVACETATKTNMVMVFGEITTKAKVDYEAVVRQVCRDVGFISDETGLDGTSAACSSSCTTNPRTLVKVCTVWAPSPMKTSVRVTKVTCLATPRMKLRNSCR